MRRGWASVVAIGLCAVPLAAQGADASGRVLAPLGVVEFELEAWRARRLGAAHVDRERRVWLCDEAAGRLHVYDERGRPLFSCRPEPAGEFARGLPCWFADGPGTRLFVGTRDALFDLDAEGRTRSRLSLKRPRRQLSVARTRFEATDERLWFRPECEAAREIGRASSATQSFFPLALAPDGGLIACEQDSRSDSGARAPVLHRFGPDGTPLGRAPLAVGRMWVLDLCAHEAGLTLLVDASVADCGLAPQQGELLQLTSDGELRTRQRLPADFPRARQLFLPSAGGELLILAGPEPQLFRFAR